MTYFSLWVETDFLSSDVMHGEGNLLAHLVIIGYKVFYEQVCSSNCVLYLFACVHMFGFSEMGMMVIGNWVFGLFYFILVL